MSEHRNHISIAILALGGQGGGVLAEWIQDVAREAGWLAQGTSVPGVAQRTGSTVYYVELSRRDTDGRLPIMAQMPMPGDVDIVIASELMETGRALLRGFSTAARTTLIGSTHRVYAISEKASMGDGRGSSERIIEAAHQRSKRFIGFDMEAATDRSNSVISAIMFGALGGSGALPFSRDGFEKAIKDSGIAVPSNLAGFDEGFRAAQGAVSMPVEEIHEVPAPSTAEGRSLDARARSFLPEAALTNALHGISRLMDYQDASYASLYLDRLEKVTVLDSAPWTLSIEAARHLALWMSYEDTIRVADLKIRASRVSRVGTEVKVGDEQILEITEFMHPRLQEIGETVPAWLGRPLLKDGVLSRLLAPFVKDGRQVKTTSLHWFLMLRLVAGMRKKRRSTIRYKEEQERIEQWLQLAETLAVRDKEVALEWVRTQRLIKGYGDTFERGVRNFEAIKAAFLSLPASEQGANWLRNAVEKALGDDRGEALQRFLAAA